MSGIMSGFKVLRLVGSTGEWIWKEKRRDCGTGGPVTLSDGEREKPAKETEQSVQRGRRKTRCGGCPGSQREDLQIRGWASVRNAAERWQQDDQLL